MVGAGKGAIDKREVEDFFHLFVLARFEGIAKGKVKEKGEEIEVGSMVFHYREASDYGLCGWDSGASAKRRYIMTGP
jgi:hypothetical protein